MTPTTPTLNDALTILLTGAVVPVLSAIIIRPEWSPSRKRAVSGAVAVVLAVIAAVATGMVAPPAGADWPVWQAIVSGLGWCIPAAAVVVTVSQSIYQQMRGSLDKLAEATSPTYAREA